jgi:hypothetical protein
VIDDGEAGDADGSYIDSRVSLMHIVGISAANLTPMLPIESGGLHDSHRISTESAFINAPIIIAYIDLLGTWLNNRSAILRPFVLQLDGCGPHLDPELILHAFNKGLLLFITVAHSSQSTQMINQDPLKDTKTEFSRLTKLESRDSLFAHSSAEIDGALVTAIDCVLSTILKSVAP